MKIITLNCNGIRSAIQKGLLDFFKKEKADFLCLQEIKAEESQIDLSFFEENGYHTFINSAEKKGYSGTAIFSLKKPLNVAYGIGHPFFDKEGRCISLEYKNFILIDTYFPSGTSGEERQELKMEFLEHYIKFQKSKKEKKKKLIICGDVNIAHTEMDIHNPKGNEKNSGFLPEEREWLTKFLNLDYIDAYRFLNPEAKDYSWWTYRFNARKNNKGWRIDYFFASKNLEKNLVSCKICKDVIVSDHAPVVLELNLKE